LKSVESTKKEKVPLAVFVLYVCFFSLCLKYFQYLESIVYFAFLVGCLEMLKLFINMRKDELSGLLSCLYII
jgi:hypothetical protein